MAKKKLAKKRVDLDAEFVAPQIDQAVDRITVFARRAKEALELLPARTRKRAINQSATLAKLTKLEALIRDLR